MSMIYHTSDLLLGISIQRNSSALESTFWISCEYPGNQKKICTTDVQMCLLHNSTQEINSQKTHKTPQWFLRQLWLLSNTTSLVLETVVLSVHILCIFIIVTPDLLLFTECFLLISIWTSWRFRDLFCRSSGSYRVTYSRLPVINRHGSCASKLNLLLDTEIYCSNWRKELQKGDDEKYKYTEVRLTHAGIILSVIWKPYLSSAWCHNVIYSSVPDMNQE